MESSKQEASFIPKRNPIKKSKHTTPRPVFVGTIIIRVIFFSVLMAALAVFTYQKKLENTLDSEIISFNNAIASFDERSLENILEIDNRIYQAKNRLDHTVSVASIFEAMELATVQSIQINDLELVRSDDDNILVTTNMKTDSFDTVLFQRSVLESSDKLSVLNVDELSISKDEFQNPNLTFSAELSVDTELVPHAPAGSVSGASSDVVEESVEENTQPATAVGTTTEDNQVFNEESI